MDAKTTERIAKILSFEVKEPEIAAKEISDRYNDIYSLAIADVDELSRLEHVGHRGARLLRLVMSLRSRAGADSFKFGRKHTDEEIVALFKSLFFSLSNETVYLLLLDDKGRVKSCEFVCEGTVNASSILPRKLLELMIKKNCRDAILAHNHPYGYARPSAEDVDTTARIAALLNSADRRLLKHYVIAGDEYCTVEQ
jgi:DNA repair protein RadC